jgi:hypothetical protein
MNDIRILALASPLSFFSDFIKLFRLELWCVSWYFMLFLLLELLLTIWKMAVNAMLSSSKTFFNCIWFSGLFSHNNQIVILNSYIND